MYKKIVIAAATFACLAVILGAFGAHGLKNRIDADALASFETGVRYQMYHALAMLFIGLSSVVTQKIKNYVFVLFSLGIILFSGSIYLLSLKEILPFPVMGIALVTPLGGSLFIIGWILFIVKITKLKTEIK